MNKVNFLLSIIACILFTASIGDSFAHPHMGQIMIDDHTHDSQTKITPLDGMLGLEKSTVILHVPESNSLPWGFVEGKIANHAKGYPVIIKILKEGDPVHFAQTAVDQNGVYEYKFRVQSLQNDNTTKIFDGDYTVKIFKVVYLDNFI